MISFTYPVKVFATTGTRPLATEICQELDTRLPRQFHPQGGMKLGHANVTWFSNQNPQVQVENVRGHFVVVVHTQVVPHVSDDFVELLALLYAIKNADAKDVLLVLPYMPYSRSDRKNKPRISVMAKVFAQIITRVSKIERVLLLDPHSTNIKHYFDPDANEISSTYMLVDHLLNVVLRDQDRSQFRAVFADSGAVTRFEHVPHLLDIQSVYINKGARPDDHESVDPKAIVGDVAGMHCLLIDDEILTSGTSCKDADLLLGEGRAASVTSVAVHPVIENQKMDTHSLMASLEASRIERFIVTDTIPIRHKLGPETKFRVLSVVPLLAEAIARCVQEFSLSDLRELDKVKLYRPQI